MHSRAGPLRSRERAGLWVKQQDASKYCIIQECSREHCNSLLGGSDVLLAVADAVWVLILSVLI